MTHKTDTHMVPGTDLEQQAAIARIVDELTAGHRTVVSTNVYRQPGARQAILIVTHRPQAEMTAPTGLEPVGTPSDGTMIFDAPSGPAGRALIDQYLGQLEADGMHLLDCQQRTTNRPGTIRYHITYRPRTFAEDRVYRAIHKEHTNEHEPAHRTNRKTRSPRATSD